MAGRGQRVNSDVGSGRVRPHVDDAVIPMSRLCVERHIWAPQGMPSKHVMGAGSEDWVDRGNVFVYLNEVKDENGRTECRMHAGVYGDNPDHNDCPREPRPAAWEFGKVPLVTPQPTPVVHRCWVAESLLLAANANSDKVLAGQGIPVTKSAWAHDKEKEAMVEARQNSVSHNDTTWVDYSSRPRGVAKPNGCFAVVWSWITCQ
jgi:hypothetical protein